MERTQTETLKQLIDLEKNLSGLKQKLQKVANEQFKSPPAPPVLKTVQRKYPEVKSSIKFNPALAFIPMVVFFLLGMTSLLLTLGAYVWFFIYYFKIYKHSKKVDEENIRNSDDYKNKCQQLDIEFDNQDAQLKAEFEKNQEMYNAAMAQYNQEYEIWKKNIAKSKVDYIHEINTTKQELNDLYDESRLIPKQYRTLEAMTYIYDIISTSNYDVTYAINDYNTYQQRILDKQRLEEQMYANQLADEQNALLNEQADLLSEQNYIAEKARKDANIRGVVSAVQHHNTNKMLKDYTSRKK